MEKPIMAWIPNPQKAETIPVMVGRNAPRQSWK